MQVLQLDVRAVGMAAALFVEMTHRLQPMKWSVTR